LFDNFANLNYVKRTINNNFPQLLDDTEHMNTQELSIVVSRLGALPEVRMNGPEKIGENEIRVEMIVMGYCGRDKSIVTGEKGATPGRIGHEGTGVVREIGPAVTNVNVGDNIIIFPFLGHHNIGYDWPDGGKGIFSTYPVIPADSAYKTGKTTISDKEWLAFTLIEPFSGAARGLKRGNVAERDCVVILGSGTIGCAQAILAKHMNPQAKIILSDISKIKLKTAEEKGVPADSFCSPDILLDTTSPEYALLGNSRNPLIIHSNPSKKSLKQAFGIAPDQSTLLLFSGIYDWTDSDDAELGFSICPKELHYEEYNTPQDVTSQGKRIKLLGSRGFAWEDFDYTAKLIINHVINPLPLVTKILKFNADILKHLQHEGVRLTPKTGQ